VSIKLATRSTRKIPMSTLRPTVPMTRVTLLPNLLPSCRRLFLCAASCLIEPWIYWHQFACVPVLSDLRRELDQRKSGHPCRRRLAVSRSAGRHRRCRKPSISRSPINRQRRRFTGHFEGRPLEIAYFQNELPTQPISFELTRQRIQHLSFQKRLGKIVSGQSARRQDREGRHRASQAQDPRSRF